MYVVLVGVEVWVERDEIEIVDNADTTMNNFLEYRRQHISPTHPNDNAQLITSVHFSLTSLLTVVHVKYSHIVLYHMISYQLITSVQSSIIVTSHLTVVHVKYSHIVLYHKIS